MTNGTRYGGLNHILAAFRPAGECILSRRRLLRRIDTKFLVPASCLESLLERLADDYGVLRAGDRLVARYESLYFDTKALSCFHDHRRGRRPRQKVRVRHYPDREVTFLEVKTKMNELLTLKDRLERRFDENGLDRESIRFLDEHFRLPAGSLVPQAWTNFHRLTLIGLHSCERVTFDMDVELVHGGRDKTLPGVVIAEVKQSPFCARTPIMRALRDAGLRPASTSKYCAAIALTSTGETRINRLLPSLRAVERIAA